MSHPVSRRHFIGAAATTLAMGYVAPLSALALSEKDLSALCSRLEQRLQGRLGVALIDTATGTGQQYRGNERFPLCSTFKLLACAAILSRVDAKQENLERLIAIRPGQIVNYSPVTQEHVGASMPLGDICHAALTQSDNTAGNLLLEALGGPTAITTFARTLNDEVTRLDRWETALNEAIPGDPRDTTTPQAMASDVHRVLDQHLSIRARQQLSDWLVHSQTGFSRLRAGLPSHWQVGDKTGMGQQGSTCDLAVIWPPGKAPIIAAVYMAETPASVDERNRAFADIGRFIAENGVR